MPDHQAVPPPSSAFLDPPESSVTEFPHGIALDDIDREIGSAWRHSGWQATRKRVRQALLASVASVSRIAAFESCGDAAYVLRDSDDPGRYRIVGSGCRDRFCLPCQRERSRVIATNIVEYLDGAPVRFATLTLRHSTAALTHSLDRLLTSFRALRRSPTWRRHVTGGLACLEITRGRDNKWHPHLHVLIQGRYLPHSELRSAWFAATGDSTIVDIRMARGDAEVVRYVAKYSAKPYDSTISRDFHLLLEMINALSHRKTIITFGAWRDLRTTSVASDHAWEYVCTLRELVQRAADRDAAAVSILASLAGDGASQLVEILRSHNEARPPPSPSAIVGQSQHVLDFADSVPSPWTDYA